MHHDDVMTWARLLHHWPWRGKSIHRWFPHTDGSTARSFMFSLLLTWTSFLNEQSSYQWFETQTPAWRHCSVCAYDINVMWFHVTSPECFDFSITTGLRSVSCTVLMVSASLEPTPYSLPSKRRTSMWLNLGKYVWYFITWRYTYTIAFDISSNTTRYLTRYKRKKAKTSDYGLLKGTHTSPLWAGYGASFFFSSLEKGYREISSVHYKMVEFHENTYNGHSITRP